MKARSIALEIARFLRLCRRAGVWLAGKTWLGVKWLLPRVGRGLALMGRLLAHLGRLTGRYARWTAAKPIRALDLLVTLALVAGLVSLLPGPPEQRVAVVTPALDFDSGLDCLALNIYHEARGEPQDGQLAVAKVVMNRVSDPRFPDNVCGVVRDGGEDPAGRCQFSWWCDGRSDRPTDAAAWRRSRELAEAVLAGQFDDPTGGALWYHADHVEPGWQMAIVRGPKIGRHIFYASAAETKP